jgi:ribosomal 30S subunit maturation factor RimM
MKVDSLKVYLNLTKVVDEKFEEIDLKKKEALVPPEMELIGKVDKSKGIIMMEWAEE